MFFDSMLEGKIYLKKSKMFTSSKALHENAKRLRKILGIGLTKNLGKYLEVPIIHEKIMQDIYKKVIENLPKQVIEKKCLSVVGIKKQLLSAW